MKTVFAFLMVIVVVGCSDAPQVPVQQTFYLRSEAVKEQAISEDARADLSDALALYQLRRAEGWRNATDVFERFETMFSEGSFEYFAANENYELLFFFGDEAFEAERDKAAGFGRLQADTAPDAAARVQRVHDGERGGLDASSCASCHSSGGVDGAGTASSVALFNGDGVHLSSSTLRDTPHVMGLGYLELAARALENALEYQVDFHRSLAPFSDADPYVGQLIVDDMDFGEILIFQGGAEDYSFVKGISADLKVRPFGLKGRHRFLTDVVDEALAVHFSHQSTAREERYSFPRINDEGLLESEDRTVARLLKYLGEGPERDRDGDGILDELSTGQASLLATYMSLLGTPSLRPPKESLTAVRWAAGKVLFDEVGCTNCHREALWLQNFDLRVQSADGLHPEILLPLLDEGQTPLPRRNDVSGDELGYPLFAFTDLRRHDLGAELSESRDEILPDGKGRVSAREWLTRPLWGLATTAPYLHDGRAVTVQEAILAHGGEAQEVKTAFLELNDEKQANLRIFLQGLSRVPEMLVE